MKQKIEKWQRWIDRIEDQVKVLMMYRAFNDQYVEIANANASLLPGNAFLSYFRAIYADGAAMAIRRQVTSHRDSISLRRLLEELIECPTLISRAWTREVYERPLPSGHIYDRHTAHFLADSTYKQYADESGDFLNPRLLEADLDQLESQTASVLQLTDRAIAHDDAGGVRMAAPVTFDDLDAAIVCLEQLVRKYIVLLIGRSFSSLTPLDQTNARSVFYIPWISTQGGIEMPS